MTNREKTRSPRLLAALEGEYAPTKHSRKAYLRPPALPEQLLKSVLVPGWGWERPGPDDGRPRVVLDGNGDWLGAASTVTVAFNELTHTGPLPRYDAVPGYYRIALTNRRTSMRLGGIGYTEVRETDWPRWDIPHPLGTTVPDGETWVAHTTLEYLMELEQLHMWSGDLSILDSWTDRKDEGVRLSKWVGYVNAGRKELKAAGPDMADQLADWKVSYAQAIQMLVAGENEDGTSRCLVRRPDWYHAIRGQHRATQHRKVRNLVEAGYEVVEVGHMDQITLPSDQFRILERDEKQKLIRLDPVELGAYKVAARVPGRAR